MAVPGGIMLYGFYLIRRTKVLAAQYSSSLPTLANIDFLTEISFSDRGEQVNGCNMLI